MESIRLPKTSLGPPQAPGPSGVPHSSPGGPPPGPPSPLGPRRGPAGAPPGPLRDLPGAPQGPPKKTAFPD